MSDTNFKMLCVASDKNADLIINLNKKSFKLFWYIDIFGALLNLRAHVAKGVCAFLLVIMGKKNFKKKGGKTLREYSLMKMKIYTISF